MTGRWTRQPANLADGKSLRPEAQAGRVADSVHEPGFHFEVPDRLLQSRDQSRRRFVENSSISDSSAASKSSCRNCLLIACHPVLSSLHKPDEIVSATIAAAIARIAQATRGGGGAGA